jgi:hypothetical protein
MAIIGNPSMRWLTLHYKGLSIKKGTLLYIGIDGGSTPPLAKSLIKDICLTLTERTLRGLKKGDAGKDREFKVIERVAEE